MYLYMWDVLAVPLEVAKTDCAISKETFTGE